MVLRRVLVLRSLAPQGKASRRTFVSDSRARLDPAACTLFTGLTTLLLAASLPAPNLHAHGDEVHAAGSGEPAEPAPDPDYDYAPPPPGSYRLPPIKAAADGAVLDEAGVPQNLHALLAGRITVLAFVYTRCADPSGCPLALSLLYELQALSSGDADLAAHLQLVTLSIDPDYDTPEVMAGHAAMLGGAEEGGAPWRFLTTTSRDALRPILEAYDQPMGQKTNLNDPLGPYTHQLRVLLIDRSLQVRNIYSLGFLDPRLVTNDVRTLLLEERGAGSQG